MDFLPDFADNGRCSGPDEGLTFVEFLIVAGVDVFGDGDLSTDNGRVGSA
jgi:hypothetical protein